MTIMLLFRVRFVHSFLFVLYICTRNRMLQNLPTDNMFEREHRNRHHALTRLSRFQLWAGTSITYIDGSFLCIRAFVSLLVMRFDTTLVRFILRALTTLTITKKKKKNRKGRNRYTKIHVQQCIINALEPQQYHKMLTHDEGHSSTQLHLSNQKICFYCCSSSYHSSPSQAHPRRLRGQPQPLNHHNHLPL